MKNIQYILYIFLLSIFCCSTKNNKALDLLSDDSTYFPPLDTNAWETKSIQNLGWHENALDSLLDFLETKDSKGFIILHHGKIVVEAYFNNHTSTTPWYWASAGKTLTTTLAGIAQSEGLLEINTPVSNYLGTGWTSVALEKENLITCKHLLSMTSGLDDSLGDNISSTSLYYKAGAGTRWAYHNVYKKMQDIIAIVNTTSWTSCFNNKLKNKIGMSGTWIQNNDFNVFWSNTRSMARFGLLIYANGMWDTNTIVPELFLNEATSTSQPINKAYGYLWWLNGKDSYYLPNSLLEFSGTLIPNAPNDMYAALGKNDQKIYIVPSENLVIIRMGENTGSTNLSLSNFDNDLWAHINNLIH